MLPEGLEPKNDAEVSDAADESEQPALEAQERMDGVTPTSNVDAVRTAIQPRPQSRRLLASRAKRRGWSASEMSTLALLHAVHGNKWSVIARHYRNRHDGDVKNIFHSALRSKMTDGNCLLRAYAQAVGPSCDDPRVRQVAYETARQQCGSAPLLSSAVSYAGVQPPHLGDDKLLEEESAGTTAADPSDDPPPPPADEEGRPSGRPSASGTPTGQPPEADDLMGAGQPGPSNPQPPEPPSALRPRRSRRLAMLVESAQAVSDRPMQDVAATAIAAAAVPNTVAISQRLPPHDMFTQLRAHRPAAPTCPGAEADSRPPPEPSGDAVFCTATAMDAFATMTAGVGAALALDPGGSRMAPPPALPPTYQSSGSHALPSMPAQMSLQLLAARSSAPSSTPASTPAPTPVPSPTPLRAGPHAAAPSPTQLPPPSDFGVLPGMQPWAFVPLYGSVPPPQHALASYNALAGEMTALPAARRPPRSVSLPVQVAAGGTLAAAALQPSLSLRPAASTPAPPPTPISTGLPVPCLWQQSALASCGRPDAIAWHQQRHQQRTAAVTAAATVSYLPEPIGPPDGGMAEGRGSRSDTGFGCLDTSAGGQGAFAYFNDAEMQLLGDMGPTAAGAGVSALYGSAAATAAAGLGGGRAGGGGGGGGRPDVRDPIAAMLLDIDLYDDPFDMALATGLGSVGRSDGGLPDGAAAWGAPGGGSQGPHGGTGGASTGPLRPPSACGPATGTSQSPASLAVSLRSSHSDMWQGGNQSDGLALSGTGFASAGANLPALLKQQQQQQQKLTSPLLGSFDWQRPVALQMPSLTLSTSRSAQLQPIYHSTTGTTGTTAPIRTALPPPFSLHPVLAPGLGTGLATGQGVGAGLAQVAAEAGAGAGASAFGVLTQAYGSCSSLPAMGAGLYGTVEGPVESWGGAPWTHAQMQMQVQSQAQMQRQVQTQALGQGPAPGVLCSWGLNPYSAAARHPALQPPVLWEPLSQQEPGSQAMAARGVPGQTAAAGAPGGLQAAGPSVTPALGPEPQGGVPGQGAGGAWSDAVQFSW